MHARQRGAGSRLIALFTAAAAAIAMVAVPATASPPDRSSDTALSVDCTADDVFVGVFAVEFDDGSFLDVFVDTGEGFLFGTLDGVELDGTSVTGTVELVDDSTGEPVGTATVDATLTPDGPTETFLDRFREGNRLERFEQSSTPALVIGSITLEGALDRTIDLSSCTGMVLEFSSFRTNPATFVDRFDERYLECMVEAPGVFGFVSAFSSDRDGPFLDVFLDEFDGGTLAGFAEDVVFDDTALVGAVELYDVFTDEPAGVSASVEATLTSLGSFTDRTQSPRETIKVTGEQFNVQGTLMIDGESYALTGCFAEHVEGRVRFTDPPRRARPVANDLPGDAVLLGVPDSDSIDTTGTAEEPEAPCTAVYEEEGEVFEHELPIVHTAWYAFEGTGSPVTVDTTGSQIDTIVGVYDTDLNQLACVDDVFEEPDGFSLQAAVTIDTELGVTYLIQVGGFGDQRGPVTVSVE